MVIKNVLIFSLFLQVSYKFQIVKCTKIAVKVDKNIVFWKHDLIYYDYEILS